MSENDPNLWSPTPEQQFREAAERIVAPTVTRDELITILSVQFAKWQARKARSSIDSALKMINSLHRDGYETKDIMPSRTAYQLLADQAAMFLDLLKRTK